MATVTVPLKGRLPEICLVCGSAQARATRVTIPPSVTPRFGIPLAWRGGYSVVRMALPLCAKHRGEFTLQVLLRYFLFIGTVASLLFMIVLAIALQQEWLIVVGIVVTVATPIAYLIFSAMGNRNRVHPIGFDPDESITFANVSPKFVQAFKQDQLEDEDFDDEIDDEDDEPAPRTRFVEEHENAAGDAFFTPAAPPPLPTERRSELPRAKSAPSAKRSFDEKPRRRTPHRDDESLRTNRRAVWIWAAVGLGLFVFLGLLGLAFLFTVLGPGKRGVKGPIVVKRNDMPAKNLPAPIVPEIPPKAKAKAEHGKVTLGDIGKLIPAPLPIDPAWNDDAMEKFHLSDMQEYDIIHGWGKFGKDGMLGYLVWDPAPTRGNDPILVGGKRFPKGISFTAPLEAVGRVKYKVGGSLNLLRGVVALNDMPGHSGVKHSETPGVFAIVGDGRLLWKSKAIHHIGAYEAFRISIRGIDELELRVFKPGTKGHGLTVWPELYGLK